MFTTDEESQGMTLTSCKVIKGAASLQAGAREGHGQQGEDLRGLNNKPSRPNELARNHFLSGPADPRLTRHGLAPLK